MHLPVPSSPDHGADRPRGLASTFLGLVLAVASVSSINLVTSQADALSSDRDGTVLETMTLDVVDGRIQTFRTLVNPDELGNVGPVADAWAALREATQGGRPTG